MPGYPRPRNVAPTQLSDVAASLGVASPSVFNAPALGDVPPVTGITHASGCVRPGDLYVGLAGSRHHGARFAAQAARAGAVAVLTDHAGVELAADSGLPVIEIDDPRSRFGFAADRIYGEPSRKLRIIGITGTAGKTSTAYLMESGIRAAGGTPAVIGTVETRLGDLVVGGARTTPEPTDLHAMLAVALELGVDTVAMEVSSHALTLGRVTGVRFAVGGFTNFGVDHLDFHADLEEYFAAKAKLFDGRCEVEIVNLDDPAGRRLIRAGTQTYSAAGDPSATWYATDVVATGYAQRMRIHGPGGLVVDAGVDLPGRHNVANALLAVASLVAVGVDPAVAGAAVATSAGAPGRMERVRAADPGGTRRADAGHPTGGARRPDADVPAGGERREVLGIVDYAHKPGAIVEVLVALRAMVGEGGRVICVVGAGGDRDRTKRPMMGEAAAAGADLVIVTDDNPRTEDPARIRAEVLAGATTTRTEVIEVAGRREAIATAVARAVPGDVVAVLGKGHEHGQEIEGVVHPFDDRQELAVALAAADRSGTVDLAGAAERPDTGQREGRA